MEDASVEDDHTLSNYSPRSSKDDDLLACGAGETKREENKQGQVSM